MVGPSKPGQRFAPAASAVPAVPLAPAAPASARGGIPDLAALIAWIESLDASGLDGRDLTEIGLQGGNLTVDDQRNGKQWTFTNIDLSVTRPKGGGIAVTLGSQGGERPWHVRAAMTPGQPGHRIIDIDLADIRRAQGHRERMAAGVRVGDAAAVRTARAPFAGHGAEVFANRPAR